MGRFVTTRYVCSLILLLSVLIPPSRLAHAEIACPDPLAATAVATPTVQNLPAAAFPAEGGSLRVFAAASLTDAYHDIAAVLMQRHPNLTISIETAGSQALVTQLEEGASADVLATADTVTMNRAVQGGLISGEPVIFTGNRLVIVTPVGNPA